MCHNVIILAGADYIQLNTALSFPAGNNNGTTLCESVSITDDFAIEEIEDFFVSVMSESNVSILNSDVLVHIIDNDGMQFQ